MRIRFAVVGLIASFLFVSFLGHAKQVTLVTGGNRGLGAVISHRLSQNGFVVYSGTRNAEIAKPLSENLKSIFLDVTDHKSID